MELIGVGRSGERDRVVKSLNLFVATGSQDVFLWSTYSTLGKMTIDDCKTVKSSRDRSLKCSSSSSSGVNW